MEEPTLGDVGFAFFFIPFVIIGILFEIFIMIPFEFGQNLYYEITDRLRKKVM